MLSFRPIRKAARWGSGVGGKLPSLCRLRVHTRNSAACARARSRRQAAEPWSRSRICSMGLPVKTTIAGCGMTDYPSRIFQKNNPEIRNQATEIRLRYSAGTSAEARALDRAAVTQSRLSTSNPATSSRISSGWPRSIRKPKGTGISALPRGRPALTKPNTLPIWPGRRRVLQQHVARRPADANQQPGDEQHADGSHARQAQQVHAHQQPGCGDQRRHNAAHQPSFVGIGEPAADQYPCVAPTMKPVSAAEATASSTPFTVCSTVISQTCTPADAIAPSR